MTDYRHPKLLLWTACAIACLSTLGAALPYPLLAPLFVDAPMDAFNHFLGLPPKLLFGIALALNPLGILLGNLVIGPMSDHYGRRPVMLGSLLLTVVGNLVTALAIWRRDYPLFLIARFGTGVVEGNVTVARALIADLHPAVDRTRGFSYLNAALYAGWLLGPLLGGLTAREGNTLPFLVASALLLPPLLLTGWLLPRHAEPTESRPLLALLRQGNTLQLLRHPLLRTALLAHLGFTIGTNAFYEFYPLWLVEFVGYGSTGIALATGALCLMMLTVSTVTGRFGLQVDPLTGASRFALLGAITLLALALLPGHAGLAMLVLTGIPISLYNALLPAYLSGRFAEHGQGAVMGLVVTTFYLANVLIALTGSALALLDTRAVIALGGIGCLLAAIQLTRLRRQANPQLALAKD